MVHHGSGRAFRHHLLRETITDFADPAECNDPIQGRGKTGRSEETDLLAFAELYRLFRRERFDLVHTHNPKPGVMGRIAARSAGVPCVVNTVHGLYATPDDRLARRVPVTEVP